MAMKNIIVAEPPYEISGKGMPVTGRSPICIETLIRMWKMKKQISDRTRNVPPRSRDAFATDERLDDQEQIQREHDADADEAPLLAEDGEDEVGVAGGEVLEVDLRPVQESFAGDAAGAGGDLGLHHLIAGAERIARRIEEDHDPLFLKRLQEMPADRQRHDRSRASRSATASV